MKRDLLSTLQNWRLSPLRKPLILRGARQVGKSWLVANFGETFDEFIELNFDWDEQARTLFDSELEVIKVLEKIEFYTGKKIIIGQTLLFLDEIQECSNALKMLRYFKEKCPELHVIAAGSLLDFTLESVGMPVGRVQFLYLYPLSFGEFLDASGREDLRHYIQQGKSESAIHNLLLSFLKTYMWLGGMPAVVAAWLELHDAKQCQQLQDELLLAYKQDFEKYANKQQISHVESVFTAAPHQLGNKFKYSNVTTEVRSTSLKSALDLLVKAGVLYCAFHTSGQTLPLSVNKNHKRFKVFFFDIGLAQRAANLDLKDWVTAPIDVKHIGAVAEQFVAQEYIAYSEPEKPRDLYYWHKESKHSNAEVDFLFIKANTIIPVEVKSGIQGGMKSMKVFLELHAKSPYGLKISQNPVSQNDGIDELPLYALEGWLAEE